IGSYPAPGTSNAPVEGLLVVAFSGDVNIASPDNLFGDCTVKGYVKNKATYGSQLVIYYDNLSYNTKYTLKLNAAALKDSSGNPLAQDYYMELTTGPEFQRLYGASRYETSVEISKAGGSHADYVVLATGENFPDALCAAPLAVKYGAPILLTYSSYLPSVVENEINRLQPKQIFLVGGTGVISDNIKTVLENKGITVTRIAGADRYETSLEVAKYVDSSSGEAFVVTGENYPDALSIASYAGTQQIPILLTSKDNLTDKVKNYISTKGVTKTYVIGGTGVVSDNVLNSLPGAERIAGSNRYETNVKVLSNFEFLFGETFFATGEAFPDALSGAALAGSIGSPVVLVSNSMPDNVLLNLRENKGLMKSKVILGGPSVVSDYIMDEIFK
ncbi:MAG: cell wall-binding repeat-containing protein, partial [Clostridiaceae bacterium]